MLIRITKEGLGLIELLRTQPVDGVSRYYYVGINDKIPLIMVVYGKKPVEGTIWEASSGNEFGYPLFSRLAHKGKRIGKLTLRYTVDVQKLAPGSTITDLDAQINYFIKNFLV